MFRSKSGRNSKDRLSKVERQMIEQIKDLRASIERLTGDKSKKHAYPITKSEKHLNAQIKHLKEKLAKQSLQLKKQGKSIKSQNYELKEYLSGIPNSVEFKEEMVEVEAGSYEVVHSGTHWLVNGYTSVEPDPDFTYFSGLGWGPKAVKDNHYNYTKSKVISAFIPCYTESGAALERTIRSLHGQQLRKGWRIEVIIIMDGVEYISPSMAGYLSTLFGVNFNTKNPVTDPFQILSGAETIIVEPTNQVSALTRTPAVENTVGGYTLVVKRQNHRKLNSQMWWLGPHSSILNTKYCLATDCGTVFTRSATSRLIHRLDTELDLHAVTGLQRVMSMEMQGGSSWEICNDPCSYLLRMFQRYEFEVRVIGQCVWGKEVLFLN